MHTSARCSIGERKGGRESDIAAAIVRTGSTQPSSAPKRRDEMYTYTYLYLTYLSTPLLAVQSARERAGERVTLAEYISICTSAYIYIYIC